MALPANNRAALRHGAFTWFNVNGYASFKTERGLRQQLWRSDACSQCSHGVGTNASRCLKHRHCAWEYMVPARHGILQRWIPTPQSLNRRQSHKPNNNYTTATFDFDYGIDDEVHLNEDSTVQDQDDVTICCPAFQTSLSPALELKQPPLKSISNAAVRPATDTSHF